VFAFEIIASFVLPEVVQRINAVALGIQSSEAVAVAVDFVAASLLQQQPRLQQLWCSYYSLSLSWRWKMRC